MKLLLTSAGLRTERLRAAVRALVGSLDVRIAFIPTAANVEEGDKSWLIEDLLNCTKIGSVDIVDIASIPKELWLPRLEAANVLLFGGGNPFYLLEKMKESHLLEELPRLLQTKVYVGISAGSMVTNPALHVNASQLLYHEDKDRTRDEAALHLVPFYTYPHLNSVHFSSMRLENIPAIASAHNAPLYVLDDDSAVQVIDGEPTILSDGVWQRFAG